MCDEPIKIYLSFHGCDGTRRLRGTEGEKGDEADERNHQNGDARVEALHAPTPRVHHWLLSLNKSMRMWAVWSNYCVAKPKKSLHEVAF